MKVVYSFQAIKCRDNENCECMYNPSQFYQKQESSFENAVSVNGFEDVAFWQSVCGGVTANNNRTELADYFSTEHRCVPQQMNKI